MKSFVRFGALKICLTLLVVQSFAQASRMSSSGASTCDTSNESAEGTVPDCNCKVDSVEHAVKHYISPALTNLTSKAFLRYFYVDLEKPCPFYKEDASCLMEGCSVCPCSETEIPKTWLETQIEHEATMRAKGNKVKDFGWVASEADPNGYVYEEDSSKIAESSLGKLDLHSNRGSQPGGEDSVVGAQDGEGDTELTKSANYMQHLRDTEDCDIDDWTSLSEAIEHRSPTASDTHNRGVYVNLLDNPERFTGYGGPSARKVWISLQQENCFGESDDVCLEKRVFYRLMSGMGSSISVHIAKQYLFKPDPSENPFAAAVDEGTWGVNMPLYYKVVGNHPERLNNLYFAFLFVLRAVVRAGDCLVNYPYNTGNTTEDAMVREIIQKLVQSKETSNVATAGIDGVTLQTTDSPLSEYSRVFGEVVDVDQRTVEECKYGFDESELFQVSRDVSDTQQFWSSYQEKQTLRSQFRDKFRNVSSIMDCITCEKCKMWGKLQILGFGTAIKILLTPEEELVNACNVKLLPTTDKTGATISPPVSPSPFARKLLNRQEIIALLNTLNNLSKSIEFVANIHEEERKTKKASAATTTTTSIVTETQAVNSDTSARADDKLKAKEEVKEGVVETKETGKVSTSSEKTSAADILTPTVTEPAEAIKEAEIVTLAEPVVDTAERTTETAATVTEPDSTAAAASVKASETKATTPTAEEKVKSKKPGMQLPPHYTAPRSERSTGYRTLLHGLIAVFCVAAIAMLILSTFFKSKERRFQNKPKAA